MLFRSRKELTLMEIKTKLNGGFLPTKATPNDAAYDVYAPENIELKRGRQVINLKFSIELPHGYAAIIQPRSGFSAKGMLVQAMSRKWWLWLLGIFSKEKRVDADVLIGLIDEKYRGNVGVIIKSNYHSILRKAIIPSGTRIAQMRIVAVPETELVSAEELDMTDQVLIKSGKPLSEVRKNFSEHARNMMYMPVISVGSSNGWQLFKEYLTAPPLAFEICFDTLDERVESMAWDVNAAGSKLWVNTIWASLCGGYDDDRAFDTDAATVYGRILALGTSIIQTDRPEFLIRYLEKAGRRKEKANNK